MIYPSTVHKQSELEKSDVGVTGYVKNAMGGDTAYLYVQSIDHARRLYNKHRHKGFEAQKEVR